MARTMLSAPTMRTLFGVMAVVTLASLGGCSTSSGDSASATCSRYVEALRDYEQRCSKGGSIDARWAELQARYKASCDAAITLPGTSVNGTHVDRCINAMKTASCTGLGSVPECVPPAGTLADGSRCSSSEQCASTYCAVSDPSGCGVCTKTVAPGGACSATDRCAKGARCTSGTCTTVVYGSAGAACDSKALDCANGLYCDSTSKTCKVPPGVGEPCTLYCASGLTCDFAGTKTCYAPTIATAGQACGGTSKATCQSGLTCRSNVCAIITYLGPGGDCSVTGTMCKVGSCLSTTKTCPKVIPDGGACTGKAEDGVCDALAACYGGKCALTSGNKCL